ncbi:MAG: hypothetical protein HY255_02765 [Betaproteobacteria bacterium]|nr:hypothetical protein [Betaproteobacteria bacterium]
MKNTRKWILAFTLLPALAMADCETRDANPREAEYYNRTFAALQAALPAVPTKWTLKADPGKVPNWQCKGGSEGDFEIRLTAQYTYTPSKEEGDLLYKDFKKLQKEIDDLHVLPPALARERQDFLDKMSVANKASNQAYKEGNKELARQKEKEGQQYSDQGRALRDKYLESVKPQLDEVGARQGQIAYRESTVVVVLVANEHDGNPIFPTRMSEFVAGKTPTQKNPGLKVHNVRLTLTGLDAKRAEVMGWFDKGKLTALVK